jgi:hypothetical protein
LPKRSKGENRMDRNTYMVIENENNRVLAQNMPKADALTLLGLLCQYAPEVRDYTITHDYFEESSKKWER